MWSIRNERSWKYCKIFCEGKSYHIILFIPFWRVVPGYATMKRLIITIFGSYNKTFVLVPKLSELVSKESQALHI
jgi:hypothetical protein